MATSEQLITLPERVWVKVAENIVLAQLFEKKQGSYNVTCLNHGDPAPDVTDVGSPLFLESTKYEMSHFRPIDLYVMSTRGDGEVLVNTNFGKIGINDLGVTVSLDAFNNRVFEHHVFEISKRFTIAPSSVAYIVIDPTEKGPYTKDIFVTLPFSISAFGAGPINVDYYTNTDSNADGTEIISGDRYFDNPSTAHSVIRLNPTINNEGNILHIEDKIYSSAGQGNASDVSSSSKSDFIYIPPKTARYTLKLSNLDTTNTADCVIKMNWFEC